MMKYTITTVLFVALLSVLQAQIGIELNPELGDCFCEGAQQQPFMVTAEGSAGPFTYEWSSPNGYSSTAKEPDDIVLAGEYTLEVYNAYACSFTYNVVLEACPSPTFQFDIHPPSDCGVDDGHINLSLTGGTPPFTYQWYVNGSPSVTSEDFADAEEGQAYSVEVTDGNGCVHFAETPEVEQLPPLSLELSSVSGACPGLSNGAVEVVANGGAPPYQFQWSNGANTTVGELNGLPAGSYSVTVTDDDECNSTLSFVIESASLPTISVLEQTPPSCTGSTDGRIVIDVAPTAAYNIVWNNGTVGPELDQVGAGAYTVSVSSASSCEASLMVMIEDPAPLQANVTAVTSASCANANDGAVALSVSGGVPPYTYEWSGGTTASSIITGLLPGGYEITVTDDNQCTTTLSAQVQTGNPPELNWVFANNVTCTNGPDGGLSVGVEGGNAGYEFEWWSPDYPQFTATGLLATSLPAGTYCVEATHQVFGCTASGCYTLELEPAQSALPYLRQVEVSVARQDGTLLKIYSGTWVKGAGCYYYDADDNAVITDEAFNLINAGQPVAVEAKANVPLNSLSLLIDGAADIGLVPSGNGVEWINLDQALSQQLITGGIIDYRLRFEGEDQAGNGLLDMRALSEGLSLCAELPGLQGDCTWSPVPIQGVDDVHHLQKICFESNALQLSATSASSGCDGSITVHTNAPGPSVITLSGAGTTTSLTVNQSTYLFSGLCQGVYTVTLLDDNGCEQEQTIEVGGCAVITGEPLLTPVSSCAQSDGSIAIPLEGLQGGEPPYSLQWSNGATGPLNDGLSAGSYSVAITDANGCASDYTFTIGQESPNGNTFMVEVIEVVDDADNSCSGSITVDVFYSGSDVRLYLSGPGAPWQTVELHEPNWPDPVDQAYTFTGLCASDYEIRAQYSYGAINCEMALQASVESCPGFTLNPEASIQSETVVDRPFGYLEDTDGSTCWNELNCGDYRLDVYHGGYEEIESENMLGAYGECNLQIDCSNGSVIYIPPFYATESYFWDDLSECTCKRKATCKIDQDYTDQIFVVLGGQEYTEQVTIPLYYEDSGTFDETATVSNTGGVGEAEDCLSCERELTMECGDNPEPCPKCELDPGFFGDDADGDCIFDEDDPCPNIGPEDCPDGVDFDPNTGCCNYCPNDDDDSNCPPTIEYDPSTGCCDLCPDEGEDDCEDNEEFDPVSGCCDSARPGGGKTEKTPIPEDMRSSSLNNGKFAVYPAPFSSFLQLEYQDLGFENSGKVYISLLNSLGMRVYSHSYQEVFEQGTLSITNLSHLPSGIYWLEVAIEGQPPQLFKCIKQ